MNLPYFSNARTVRNAMDRARMNSAIRTFERFAIQRDNGGVCSVDDLKLITPYDFQVLVDDLHLYLLSFAIYAKIRFKTSALS